MKKFSFGLFFLIVWMLLVSTGVFLYLAYLQPTKLGATISYFLKEKTNLEFNIESVRLSFSPCPGVTVKNIVFYDKTLTTKISVEEAQSELSLNSIIMLKPVLKRLAVSGVDVHVTLPKREQKQTEFSVEKVSQEFADKFFSNLKDFSIPHYFSSLYLSVENANGEIFDPNTEVKYVFQNFSGTVKTPDILEGEANLSLEELTIYHKDYLLFYLEQTKILADDVSYNPGAYSGTLLFETNLQVASLLPYYDTPVEEAYNYFPMPKPAFIRLSTDFDIKIRQKTIALTGKLYNNTVLPMNGYPTPVELNIPFTLTSTPQKEKPSSLDFPHTDKHPYKKVFLQENTLSDYALDLPGFYINEINIKNATITADSDSLIFTGALTGLYPFNPLIFGKAHVENFSLPRWIGPTREMNGGLYNALNAIKADIDVFCTLKGVFSPNLTATVLNYSVKGKSVTANFAKADICFDLEMLSENNSPVDLNPLFPEINGKDSNKIKLPPPAVIVKDDKPEDNSSSVSYHITVRVPKQAHIWKLDCANVNVLVAPDKNSNSTIKVDIGNLYTGTANALVTLHSKQKHEISAKLNNVLIEAPLRNIIGFTVCTGHADTTATVKLQGSNLAEILNSLEIQGKINLLNGALHSKKQLLTPFSKIYADIDIKTIPFTVNKKMPESFALNGLWQIDGDFPEYTAKLYSKNSGIQFSTKTGQPLSREPQAADILLTQKDTKETILHGTAKFGFNLNADKLIVENYKGALKSSKLIANITYEQKEKANYTGDLYFQHLNLKDFMQEEKKNGKEEIKAEDTENREQADKDKKEDKNLPLDFICENNVSLSIKADKLTFYKITTSNFTGNIKIKDNKISINNLKTSINNGYLQALLEGTVQMQDNIRKMQTQFKLKGTALDMLAITKMRQLDTLMSGSGNIAIQGTAHVSKTSDIFKTMNAEWSMQFNNGYFQSSKDHIAMLEKEISPSKKFKEDDISPAYTGKTNYSALSANGTIKNGLAETKNIFLVGTGLSVQGEGTINLVTDSINALVHATYLGIPEIPITISGSISDPKYEVKVINAVSRTIGNIGTGIFKIFSNIISQPFKLFMPTN